MAVISVYVLADLHLSFGCNKPMDIFGEVWKNHPQKILENWTKKVKPTDTVIVPGDISWAMNFEEAKKDFEFIENLPGTKILSKGNHDYWWQTAAKNEKFLETMGFKTIKFLFNNAIRAENIIACGTRGWFVDTCYSPEDDKIVERECGRYNLSFECAKKLKAEKDGEIVAFLHYPLSYGGIICEKLANTVARSGVDRCYYGHLHGADKNRVASSCKGVKTYLVAGDFINFDPVLISE